MALDISKRKLQYDRDSGIMPYTMMGGKVYYSKEDVENILKNNLVEPQKEKSWVK